MIQTNEQKTKRMQKPEINESTPDFTLTLSGKETRILSLILTEYTRNMTKLVMGGRIKPTPELERELVIVSNVMDKLAAADFELRANKEIANALGFSV